MGHGLGPGVGRNGRAAAAAVAAALCSGQLTPRGYLLCTESPLLVLHLPSGAVPDITPGASHAVLPRTLPPGEPGFLERRLNHRRLYQLLYAAPGDERSDSACVWERRSLLWQLWQLRRSGLSSPTA